MVDDHPAPPTPPVEVSLGRDCSVSTSKWAPQFLGKLAEARELASTGTNAQSGLVNVGGQLGTDAARGDSEEAVRGHSTAASSSGSSPLDPSTRTTLKPRAQSSRRDGGGSRFSRVWPKNGRRTSCSSTLHHHGGQDACNRAWLSLTQWVLQWRLYI